MKYPLQFYAHGNDWQIRGADLRPVLKINIEGQDFIQQKETEKFCRDVVDRMNTLNTVILPALEPVFASIPDIPQTNPVLTNGNGHLSPEPPKKRGRPFGSKNK